MEKVAAGQTGVQNRLLSGLPPADFALLQPDLQPTPLRLREVLVEPGERIERVYFPESGLISVVSLGEVETEVGIVGREGLAGISVLLGVDRAPLRLNVQSAGSGLAMPVGAFQDAVAKSAVIRNMFLRYAHVFMMQSASTSYANAHFTVEQRLARWLLMTHDRLDGDDVDITHEFLAMMLCVRRPGVTVATHVLEGNHAIRARRGRITILDREKLADLARDGYGFAEAEYERLIAPAVRTAELRQSM